MDRLIYLSMSGAKATMQRQDVLANNLANASTNGFRAELQAFRAVPVRGDGASTRVYALESTVGHDTAQRPGADHRPRAGRGHAGQRPGWPCRRWTAPRPTPAPARCRSTPKASSSPPPACRCWATAGRSRCRPMPRSTWPRRHHHDHGGQRPAATGRPPEAGDARGAAGARRRRPVPRRRRRPARPTRRRGCSRARWKAPTSARWRPWWP